MSLRSVGEKVRADVLGDIPPLLISIDEAARRLGVSRLTVRSLLGRELVDRRVGRRRLVVSASVDRFVAGGGA